MLLARPRRSAEIIERVDSRRMAIDPNRLNGVNANTLEARQLERLWGERWLNKVRIV